MIIRLPISKSIANRILLLQAIHGDPLMRVSSDMPDDVIILHDALETLRKYGHKPIYTSPHPLRLYLGNCGTALRFLRVHLQMCYPGEPIVLEGDPRLMERDGKPTSQTTSALILHGVEVPVSENESPYITMSRRIKDSYSELRERSYSEAVLQRSGLTGVAGLLEADWSAAAFWYEYVAIHGGEVLLEGLKEDSLQGDRVVADIYAEHFGVQTTFTPEGAVIQSVSPAGGLSAKRSCNEVVIDFVNIPDLYPAVALTCERLGLELKATGTERLRYKESDRLEAVRLHEVRNDHRMAMALMAADYIKPLPTSPEGKEIQTIISKSYPQFAEILQQIHHNSRRSADGQPTVKYNVASLSISHITPIRGVNDDNLGKKHALSKLIHAADTEYIWMHDDDVEWPKAIICDLPLVIGDLDLIILPLRMESAHGVGSSLLERLQIAEYAAIQELTIRMAKKGHAVMCSGANLIVKREVWLACEAELHPEIPSGDDMFLLEAVKRHGYKIGVIDEPDYTAIVRPQTTWRAFFRQRMRWAGKAPKYTDKDIIRCGALVAAANILQILCPLIILIKFPIEYSLIRKRLTPPFREGSGVGFFFVALLLEIVYPIYLLISLLGGLFSRRAW
ncbi:MAG: glycosyltransferase [Paludibacteraceae bacterium]|nr:glycosyltransferase [Paludibacteraceae bacterium]